MTRIRMQNSNPIMFAAVVIIVVVLAIAIPFSCGIGGFGPENEYDVTVLSKHVDIESTHTDDGTTTSTSYMVTTDKGTFEVDNGILLDVWNADEIYGQLQEGKKYRITTKGKQYVNMFMQEYPYIVKVENAR